MRETRTPLRRFIAQTIMWMILAASVGTAALVDRHIGRQSQITLGPVSTFEYFEIRLPRGWTDQNASDSIIQLRQPRGQDILDILIFTAPQWRSFVLHADLRSAPSVDQIAFGEVSSNVLLQELKSGGVLLSVYRPLNNQMLLLQLLAPDADERDLPEKISLLRQVAATMKPRS